MQFREIKIPKEWSNIVAQEITDGRIVNGKWVKILETDMCDTVKAAQIVAVNSGTMALKIALKCAGVKPGDRVIVPDITFVACASVVHELGAIPVYVDVDPSTFLLDVWEAKIMSRIGVKAIIAVRLGGEEIPPDVYDCGIPVIVDSAHSMDPHDPRAFATCYSFHPSKIISGIEGGMIATNNLEMVSVAKKMRLFGFSEGSRIASMWGYKGNMSNVSACLICFQRMLLPATLAQRREILGLYNKEFGLMKSGLGAYMVTVDDPDAICAKIPAIRHYPKPLSLMVTMEEYNPKAEWVSEHLISLPFHEHLSTEDVDIVCAIVKPHLISYRDTHGTTGT